MINETKKRRKSQAKVKEELLKSFAVGDECKKDDLVERFADARSC